MILRVAAAAILLPVVVMATLYFPTPLFILFIEVFLVLAVWELLLLLGSYEAAIYWFTLPLVISLPWLAAYRAFLLPSYFVLAAMLCMAWSVFRPLPMRSRLPSLAGNLGSLIYVGIPFAVAAGLQRHHPHQLLMVLFIIWASDMGAYFVGKKWGKRKITPRLSPNKTLEGFMAGFSFGLLAAVASGYYLLPDWPASRLALLGALLAPAGMLGDLFESMLKRAADLKDSSQLIPGHGGVLDRIDSLLFALPAYYAFTTLIK